MAGRFWGIGILLATLALAVSASKSGGDGGKGAARQRSRFSVSLTDGLPVETICVAGKDKGAGFRGATRILVGPSDIRNKYPKTQCAGQVLMYGYDGATFTPLLELPEIWSTGTWDVSTMPPSSLQGPASFSFSNTSPQDLTLSFGSSVATTVSAFSDRTSVTVPAADVDLRYSSIPMVTNFMSTFLLGNDSFGQDRQPVGAIIIHTFPLPETPPPGYSFLSSRAAFVLAQPSFPFRTGRGIRGATNPQFRDYKNYASFSLFEASRYVQLDASYWPAAPTPAPAAPPPAPAAPPTVPPPASAPAPPPAARPILAPQPSDADPPPSLPPNAAPSPLSATTGSNSGPFPPAAPPPLAPPVSPPASPPAAPPADQGATLSARVLITEDYGQAGGYAYAGGSDSIVSPAFGCSSGACYPSPTCARARRTCRYVCTCL